MGKNLLKISVKTLPNGYGLTVGDVEYMYFNEVDLMAGFMAHVGLGETNPMEKGSILTALMSSMLGESYADAVTTLKQRVGLLTSQYNTTIDRMDKAIEYVTSSEKTIDGLVKRIAAIENELKATEEQHAMNKKVANEVKEKLSDYKNKADKLMESLVNSETIMKAIEETEEAAKKKAKKNNSEEEPVTTKSNRKGKGGRNKDADAAIVKEIEKKAKKNPNIK